MCARRSSPRKVTVTGQGWQSHAQKRTFLGSDHLGEGWREVRRVTLSVRGRCNRIPQRGQLKQGRFISDKTGGCQSKTKVPVLVTCQGPLSGSWSGWHLLAASSRGRRGEGALWGPSHKGTNPFMGASGAGGRLRTALSWTVALEEHREFHAQRWREGGGEWGWATGKAEVQTTVGREAGEALEPERKGRNGRAFQQRGEYKNGERGVEY